ncbi:hypothetical protein ACFQ0X_06715 [Streptomyces rectiviolaceus]|uniref:Uncharacterized protein n=1 Tax=Streptomyces rectiviolaceus TaxID=332591 RepID=A0ABP6NCH2_9ACTN
MKSAARGIAIGSARLSMLVVAIAIISTPWIAGWAFSTAAVWNASFIIVLYAANILLLRSAARDIRKHVPQGERVRLSLPVRRRVGRLPYPLLGEEFAVALTDRRLLLQPRSIFTGRPRGDLYVGERISFRQGKTLAIETESGVRINALVPMTHRHDVAHWMQQRQHH